MLSLIKVVVTSVQDTPASAKIPTCEKLFKKSEKEFKKSLGTSIVVTTIKPSSQKAETVRSLS